MIIKRLAEGIRNQDWFVVMVEIMIVVVGIFIGLQVDDWNERRLERLREAVVIERLHAEAEAITLYFLSDLERRISMIDRVERAIRAISSSGLGTRPSDDELFGLTLVSRFPAISPPRIVYDELSSSGDISIIEDQAIRDAVAIYNRQLVFVQAQLPAFRASSMSIEDLINSGITSVYDPESTTRQSIEYDFEKLVAGGVAKSRFVVGIRNQIVFSRYARDALDAAHAMCTALAKQNGQDCPDIEPLLTEYTISVLKEAAQ